MTTPTPLTEPIPTSGQALMMEMDGTVEGYITVDLSEAVDNDLEGLLDIISNRLVGHGLLQDISYEVAGASEEGELILKVSGLVDENDINDFLEDENE